MQDAILVGQERRRHVRQPATDLPIRCSRPGQEAREAHSLRDISQGGLQFTAPEVYLPGEPVTVEFPALDEDSGLRGAVLWSGRTVGGPQRYATGISFLEPQLLLKRRIIGKIADLEARRA